MSDLQTLANTMLAHAPALTLGIGAVVAVGVIIVIVMLAWPRKPIHDPVAEQRMAELNARVQTMGELLARAQSQLQHTVHERLDAVTIGWANRCARRPRTLPIICSSCTRASRSSTTRKRTSLISPPR